MALTASSFSLATITQAAQPSIKWDSSGMADISAPPFTWELELSDYTNPSEITKREKVEVEVELDTDLEPCSADLNLIPMRDGVPIGPPVPIDPASDLYGHIFFHRTVKTETGGRASKFYDKALGFIGGSFFAFRVGR